MASAESRPWFQGTVVRIIEAKSFGFIRPSGPEFGFNRDIYFRTNVVIGYVRVNDVVKFQLKNNGSNGKPFASRVKLMSSDEEDSLPGDVKTTHPMRTSESLTSLEVPVDLRDTSDDDDDDGQALLKRRAQLDHKLKLGKIARIKDHFGFVSLAEENNQSTSSHDIYFTLRSSHSGLLPLLRGDEVSFFISEKKHPPDSKPYAYNVRLQKCVGRSAKEIDDYILSLLDPPSETSNLDNDISAALLCIPVWQCVGRTSGISISRLVELLLEFKEIENLKNNFVSVIETLLRSKLFNKNDGPFFKYVQKIVSDGVNSKLVSQVQELIHAMIRLVPNRSRQLTAFLSPMISRDPSSTEAFLYRLLRQVVKGTSGDIESMDWDELPLVPSVDELLSVELESYSSLQCVLTEGPYQSADVYLDTYFRLLRVDCFSSLTKGVTDLLKGKLDSRDMHVYRGVRLAGVHLTLSGEAISIGLHINPPPGVNLDQSSNLMFGNLLCISVAGTFRDPIWATVVNRELLKSHRIIVVELCSESNSMTDSEAALALYFAGPSTVIVESPTYYRAYQPVLKSMQLMTPEDLFFFEELVHCKRGSSPEYISDITDFDSKVVYQSPQLQLNVISYCLDESCIGQTTLDPSQETAIKECLRHRIAIVQGPPGTGKTFVGVKVVQLLLSLSEKLQAPILILTYKNHSLDEFLKEIVSLFPNEVARVGGRSQEADLANCSMHELRKKHRMCENDFKQISAFKSELEGIKASIEDAFQLLNQQRYFTVEMFIECLSNEQVFEFLVNCNWQVVKMKSFRTRTTEEFTTVRKYITRNTVEEIIKEYKEHSQLSQGRLADIIRGDTRRPAGKLYKLLEKALQHWIPPYEALQKFEKDFTRQDFTQSNYEQAPGGINTPDDVIPDEKDADEIMKERLASATTKQSDAKELLKSMSMFTDMNNDKGHLLKIAKELSLKFPLNLLLSAHNLWHLSVSDRIQLMQCVLHRKFEEAGKQFESVVADYQAVYRRKQELENQHKTQILQAMKVVGMTVTGANINRGLISQLKPAVVLVEEAAEVLEPQLVAVLGNWTKHLIMIGDHKQLRPSVENYKLAQDYHLDVSMMERLINNNFSHATLTMQNRMRPEFAELLLDIYPNLQSNLARVQKNKQANCIAKSMYFWDHRDEEVSGRSFTNPSEAERAVRLSLFLIEQGYSPKQITVLSPYLGQVRLIRQKIQEAERTFAAKLFAEAKGKDQSSTPVGDKSVQIVDKSVQVCTVDLYQGDENDFVIISLVRSNSRGLIGFVKLLNRRCVAQSRSRCGLYFIGNSETLSKHKYWFTLIDKFNRAQCLGPAIPLHCPIHPSNTTHASTAMEVPFEKTFCRVICNAFMPCGKHICERTCQPRHSHIVCHKLVEFIFSACGHVGTKECHQDQSKEVCSSLVPIQFPQCGHQGSRKCHLTDNDVSCMEPCTKILECSHLCEKKCGEICDPKSCPMCKKIQEAELEKRRQREEMQRETVRQQALDKIAKIKSANPEEIVHQEDLLPDGDTAAEYFSVEDRVKRYVQPGHNWFPRITRIEKITNLALEAKWLEIQSKMFDPTRHELKFHGTNKTAVSIIIKDGFMLPKMNKQMFGPGLYFASDSSKSAQNLYTKGSNMLLLCDVLLGRSKTVVNAHQNMTAERLRKEKYDSLFAKRDTKSSGGVQFDEFVVYNEHQAIPRYIVHYETLDCRSMPNTLEQQVGSSGTVVCHHITQPKRQCEMGELEMHYRLAESQFLRLMMKKGKSMSVDSVDYYVNPTLLAKFSAMQEHLKAKYVNEPDLSQSVLGFHGTKKESIENIVNTNFDISKLSANTGSQGKYGAGIYFSEFPGFSLLYGNTGALLLCRVLTGKAYDCLNFMPGAPLQQGYDSHRAKADEEGRGQELVIFNADQILPCYVINYSDSRPTTTG